MEGPLLQYSLYVWQVAPLSFVVAAAGGSTHDGEDSVLQRKITSTQERSAVSLGSHDLVQQSIDSMKASR